MTRSCEELREAALMSLDLRINQHREWRREAMDEEPSDYLRAAGETYVIEELEATRAMITAINLGR